MYTIATRHALRQYLQLADDDTADDIELMKALQQASHMIESVTHRRYCPSVRTLTASINTDNPTLLILPDDLLSLITLTNGDGAIISPEHIQRIPNDNNQPASALHLIDGEAFIYDASPHNAISIHGIWGWHDRWSIAWRDSTDTVQDAPLSSNSATITVSNTHGTDVDGFSPRFQIGQLLQLDSEYVRILAIDDASNQLTVQRGTQGTSATSHPQGTAIQVYHPASEIHGVTLRYAELLFKSIGITAMTDDPILQGLRRYGA
jgi:hypothetical protein